MMKVTGKVKSKVENAEGHSQVTIEADVDLSGVGEAQGTLPKAQIIVSTPSVEIIEKFKVGQKVTFNL
jgi:hypothetical protein